jgi:hypothetical protein
MLFLGKNTFHHCVSLGVGEADKYILLLSYAEQKTHWSDVPYEHRTACISEDEEYTPANNQVTIT